MLQCMVASLRVRARGDEDEDAPTGLLAIGDHGLLTAALAAPCLVALKLGWSRAYAHELPVLAALTSTAASCLAPCVAFGAVKLRRVAREAPLATAGGAAVASSEMRDRVQRWATKRRSITDNASRPRPALGAVVAVAASAGGSELNVQSLPASPRAHDGALAAAVQRQSDSTLCLQSPPASPRITLVGALDPHKARVASPTLLQQPLPSPPPSPPRHCPLPPPATGGARARARLPISLRPRSGAPAVVELRASPERSQAAPCFSDATEPPQPAATDNLPSGPRLPASWRPRRRPGARAAVEPRSSPEPAQTAPRRSGLAERTGRNEGRASRRLAGLLERAAADVAPAAAVADAAASAAEPVSRKPKPSAAPITFSNRVRPLPIEWTRPGDVDAHRSSRLGALDRLGCASRRARTAAGAA
jgi:hypothetical protein